MSKYSFKVSKNWDDLISFEAMIKDSKFVFIGKGGTFYRPTLVLNNPIEGFDLIELDYDQYGLTTNGVGKFDPANPIWETYIKDSSADVVTFIKDWLFSIDCHEFVIDNFTNAPCEKPTGKRPAIAENRELA